MSETSNLTFMQRHGKAPLPERMQVGEINSVCKNLMLRALDSLFNANIDFYGESVESPLLDILNDIWIIYLGQNYKDFSPDSGPWRNRIARKIDKEDGDKLIDLLDQITRHSKCPTSFRQEMATALKNGDAPYRLDVSSGLFYPVASAEEAENIGRALGDTNLEKIQGAREHLLRAGKYLNEKDAPDSIRESIHAVESIVCVLTKKPTATLKDALKDLKSRGPINGQLIEGIEKLYAYTNSEPAIRHPRKEESVKVDLADAVMMFGICASLVTYLLSKLKANASGERSGRS